jgi:hypothetical protein
MTFGLQDRLATTNPKHDHFIDAYAYMIAADECRLIDSYCLMYLRKRPWWMPEFVYK